MDESPTPYIFVLIALCFFKLIVEVVGAESVEEPVAGVNVLDLVELVVVG